MKLGGPAKPCQILTALAGDGATGALHVGGSSPGLLHLDGGRVIHAASARVPGVGDLLTASGRLPRSVWEAAVDEGSPDNRIGALLVGQGHLTEGELQLCVLSVVHDAAYFVLGDDEVPVRFERGRPHWLGTVTAVEVATLTAEVDRRARLLAEIIDEPRLDTAPVVPAPRLRRDRIRLTALQWELVVHADGTATPTDLARRLGRAGYACLLEVRRLAADGLVQLPPVPADAPVPEKVPAPANEAVPQNRPTPADQAVPVVIPRPAAPPSAPRAAPSAEPAAAPPAQADAEGPDPPATTAEEPLHAGVAQGLQRGGFRLPRRRPLPRTRTDGEPAVDLPDEALLRRLRTALRGMT